MNFNRESPDVEAILRESEWVRGLAGALVREPHLADDLAQDTLVVALQGTPRGSLRAWLRGIARNLAAAQRRGDAHRRDRESAVARPESVTVRDESLERASVLKAVIGLVLELGDPYRSTLLRRYQDGLSIQSIAAQDEASEPLVRKRLSRGLEQIRIALDERHGGDRRAWCALLGATLGTGSSAKVALVSTGTIAGLLVLAGAVGGFLLWPESSPLPAPVDLEIPSSMATSMLDASEGQDSNSDAIQALPAGVPKGESLRAPAGSSDMDPTVTLSATVTDELGHPVEGARLTALSIPGEPFALSGADGEVALILARKDLLDIRPQVGRYRMSSTGHATQEVSFSIPYDEDAFLDAFELAPGGILRGRVVDTHKTPIANARVTCAAPQTTWSSATAGWQRADSIGALSVIVQTDSSGNYELQGVPYGTYSVAASARRRLYNLSAPLAVSSTQVTQVNDLVLEQADESWRIEGRVLNLDGTPRANEKTVLLDTGGKRWIAWSKTDGNGQFFFLAPPGGSFEIKAGRTGHDAVFAYDVQTGMTDLVLRAALRAELTIQARGPDGTQIQCFGADARDASGRMGPGCWAFVEDSPTLTLLLPEFEFFVSVQARGFKPFHAGPFDPNAPPKELEARLVPFNGWRGEVHANGKPLAGARVDAHVVHRSEQKALLKSGLHNRFHRRVALSVSTDSSGKFMLPLFPELDIRNGHTAIYVHATAPGFAYGPLQRFDLEPGVTLPSPVLQVCTPGKIQGRVLSSPPRDLRAFSIAISQGDSHIDYQRLDRDGRFQFDGLAPGPWQAVVGSSSTIRRQSAQVSSSRVPAQTEWSFEIREGATTHKDIVFEVQPEHHVSFDGQFRINGAPALGWSWFFRKGDDLREGEFAPDGSFSANLPGPGLRWLGLRSPPAGNCGGTSFAIQLDLKEGVNEWSLDVPCAALRLDGLPQPLKNPDARMFQAERESWIAEWSDEQLGLKWTARISCAPPDGLLLAEVPVGHVTLSRRYYYDLVEGTEVEFELLSGETRTITVER